MAFLFHFRQEGVENGIYIPIEVTVRTQDGEIVKCRSYQMNDYVHDLPSPQYKRVLYCLLQFYGLRTHFPPAVHHLL